jgi:hypothetical protein
VWQEKVLYGRRFLGVVRTTYLIDEKGVVHRRWDRVKVAGHAPDVLRTAKLLKGVDGVVKRAPKKRAGERRARGMSRARGEPAKRSQGGVRPRR